MGPGGLQSLRRECPGLGVCLFVLLFVCVFWLTVNKLAPPKVIDHGPWGLQSLRRECPGLGGHRGFARGREVAETDGGRKKRKCQCTKVPTAVQKYTKYKIPGKQKY